MATHGTLMIDFVSLIFLLEMTFQFVNNSADKTLAVILGIIAVMMKQSTSIFIIPFFVWMLLENRKRIKWINVAGYGLIIFIFLLRLFVETGNPVIGFLMVFLSRVYLYRMI